jgi:hypothetical protein
MAEPLSLMAWLAEPWKGRGPFDEYRPAALPEQPSRLQVFAALLAMDTGGYGVISSGGPYGTVGLDQGQAFALMDLSAYVRGWDDGTGRVENEALKAALKAEWARVDGLRVQRETEQQQAAGA